MAHLPRPAPLPSCPARSRFQVVAGPPGDDTYILPTRRGRGGGSSSGNTASPAGNASTPSQPRGANSTTNATSAAGPIRTLPDTTLPRAPDLANTFVNPPAPSAGLPAGPNTTLMQPNVTVLGTADSGVVVNGSGAGGGGVVVNGSMVAGGGALSGANLTGECLNYAGYPSSRALWVQLCQ